MNEDGVEIKYVCNENADADLSCTTDDDCTSTLFNKCAVYYVDGSRDTTVEPTCISESSCD